MGSTGIKGATRAHQGETLTAWLLVLPALVGFAVFHAWPTARAVQISFTDWNLLREARFVGWANYARMLEDGQFWNGMKLSAVYVLLNIPLQTVLGLFLAVAMHRLTQSIFVRSVVLLPFLLSNVLVALVWLWLLDPLLGWVNHALMWLGLDRQPFFGGTGQALATIAGVQTWRHTGMVRCCSWPACKAFPATCSMRPASKARPSGSSFAA